MKRHRHPKLIALLKQLPTYALKRAAACSVGTGDGVITLILRDLEDDTYDDTLILVFQKGDDVALLAVPAGGKRKVQFIPGAIAALKELTASLGNRETLTRQVREAARVALVEQVKAKLLDRATPPGN